MAVNAAGRRAACGTTAISLARSPGERSFKVNTIERDGSSSRQVGRR